MFIKKIILNNIRSYEYQEIDFPPGSILLSGDIGCGKTTVLLAIEFALFGLQPGQRGSSLLRNGQNEGRVVIEFEIEGRNIIIERALKRGKSVSQDYCSITVNGEKKEMSVTELKNKILDILSYPLEFSKKQNILYKFTVYTPQEEMKQIMLQDPDTRINTLRHVFGIDKYKKIIENVSIITLKLREEKRMKEGLTAGLDSDKEELLTKEDVLESKHYNLASVERELFLKTESRKKIQEEREFLSEKIEERNKFHQEIEKTKIIIANKKDTILENNKLMSQVGEQVRQLQSLQFEESKITELEDRLKLQKKEIEKLNEENLNINSEITSLNLKSEDNRKLEQKLSNLQICPTCLQNVDSVYRANVLNKLHLEAAQNRKEIESLTGQKTRLAEKIKKLGDETSSIQDSIQELKILKVRLREIGEKQKRIAEIENLNSQLIKDIELLDQHLEILEKSILELDKYTDFFEMKQKELDMALDEERSAQIKVAELKKEIELFSGQIESLKERIKKTEEIKGQLHYITELEDWLSKKFVSVISFIEKNVMIKLKTQFSKLFSEWFSMLVSDQFNVKLSDNFTPVIEQQDYEIDYEYLSGGERTAVALAYRLSLNQVINSLLSKIKTKDIMILDEPTDGFSEQQLDKMRDVLQQLTAKQLIIVSHEQKIDSFVENVIKFRKEGGVSRREN
jgi:exonuclease SbcC